jgi:hypothetical protein
MLKTLRSNLTLKTFLVLVLLLVSGAAKDFSVYAGTGNAEASRTRNLQYFEMVPAQHPPGNTTATRTRNLQYFEMTSPLHPAGNSSVTRTRNLQYFGMVPSQHPAGNATITRTRNLQYFEMTPSGALSVTINSFMTTDANGTAKSSFVQGSIVLFKVVATACGSQNLPNVLVSVMVQDPLLTPILFGYTYEDIMMGKQTTIYLGFKIPYGVVGEYIAQVTILARFLSQQGEPIPGGHAEIHFTVT